MIPALLRAQCYSDKVMVALWNRSAREQLGKAHPELSISWQTSVLEPVSSWALCEQQEGGFQHNFSLLTAQDGISTWIQPQPASSGVHNRDRLFYFASWAAAWRYSNSVGFFGWTRIFLKTSLWFFITNPWNFLATLLPFLQGFVQLSIVLCFSRTFFFSVWWEDESAGCRTHSFGGKNVLFGYGYVNISVCIGTLDSCIK